MPRIALLLLLMVVGSCQSTAPISDYDDVICPCVRFSLSTINGKPLPYIPLAATDPPNTLMADSLVFEADGRVDQISVIRTVKGRDTTQKRVKAIGRFIVEPPLVTIAWQLAGIKYYGMTGNTLGVSVAAVGENWLYVQAP